MKQRYFGPVVLLADVDFLLLLERAPPLGLLEVGCNGGIGRTGIGVGVSVESSVKKSMAAIRGGMLSTGVGSVSSSPISSMEIKVDVGVGLG